MAMETGEKKKKDKKSKEKIEDNIPDSLTELPKPSEPTIKRVEPPKPITLQEKGNLPRPTRLPPKFRERIQSNLSNINEQPETSSPLKEETKEGSSTTKNILTPVSIRKHRDSIPNPEQQKEVSKVIPTRIAIEEDHLEEAISNKSSITSDHERVIILSQDLILKQFDVSHIIDRPKEQVWPWLKSKSINIPNSLEMYWKVEASLYSAIAMLHFYSVAYEEGEIAQEIYSKQLKSHLMEAIQLRFKLEKDQKFDYEKFVSVNKLSELFPKGIEKIARVTGSSDIDHAIDEETIQMNYQEIKKLPTKAADYVGNAIELMDIIRLQSIATVERLIPLIEDMKKIIITIKIFDADYWAVKEMDLWIEKLYNKEPGSIPTEEELERFEMYVVRWLNDFRRELKNI